MIGYEYPRNPPTAAVEANMKLPIFAETPERTEGRTTDENRGRMRQIMPAMWN
jgi:hypothetical protein